MDLGLRGKKVILTGGSRGIGRAALEIFAEEGCDVAFISRNPDQVAATVAALSRHGGKVIGDAIDMTDLDTYTKWLESAAGQLGGCDIFVPGASASGSGATRDWETCYNIDIRGTVVGVETLEPFLAASGSGAIVIMSSTAAIETFIAPQAFNALKAALLTYTKQISQSLGPKGIRVNAVSPGPIVFPEGNWDKIRTAMPALYDATQAQFALGRWGGPEEVARTIVFLASDGSSYTTGSNVVIDGGYTKRVQF